MVFLLARFTALLVINRLSVALDRPCQGLATLSESLAHLLIINQNLVALVLAVVISLRVSMGVSLGRAIKCG